MCSLDFFTFFFWCRRVLYVYRDLATKHLAAAMITRNEWLYITVMCSLPTDKWRLSIISSSLRKLFCWFFEQQIRQNLRTCILATMQIPPITRRNLQLLQRKVVGVVSEEPVCLNGNILLWTDTIRDQSEIPIGRNKRQDSLRLPAFESNTGMEADVIQQPWVL